MKKIKYIGVVALLLAVSLMIIPIAGAAGHADKTTKYRVYQKDQIMKEFVDYNPAVQYAKQFRSSHIEEISNRKWLWDNYARYRVYQNGTSMPQWQYATLEEAIKEAKKWSQASIRDLHSVGWAWDNFSRNSGYQVYQNEKTSTAWRFSSLKDATKEAMKWGNSHIIDLGSHRWVWDNISESRKVDLRIGQPIYQLHIKGVIQVGKVYSYLQDAIDEASKWDGASVINTMNNNTVVYTNTMPYNVLQNGRPIKQFTQLDAAINYARKWAHATIQRNEQEIWTNSPYYQVLQSDDLIGEFHTIKQALDYAMKYANASIRTYDGDAVWDNLRELQFWSWNGSSNPDSIKSQVSQTQGLDVDSPTWFELQDAEGTMKDTSDKQLVTWLKQQGIAVHPLVHNQFDAKLTTAFLSNNAAQKKFITQLIDRCVELGVDGINIDFESLSGKDRTAFTTFIQNLTKAAHQSKLIVSIDLPRGSTAWNHLTAFDHEKLASIVDYVVTMAYDQHYSGSPEAGSVAGLPWVEEGVQEFLSYGIPRDKLLLGMPLYSRIWLHDQAGNLVGNRTLLLKNIDEVLQNKSVVKSWDTEFQQQRVEYKEDGYTHVFWLEDDRSIEARLKLAKKYDLAGVAAWRLGHEHAQVWETMIRHK